MLRFLLVSLMVYLGCVGGLSAQFRHTIRTAPDSAEVYLNNERVGTAPCIVSYRWVGVPAGGHTISIRRAGFQEHRVLIANKPSTLNASSEVVLQPIYPPFDLAGDYGRIRFGAYSAQVPVGRKIGEVTCVGSVSGCTPPKHNVGCLQCRPIRAQLPGPV